MAKWPTFSQPPECFVYINTTPDWAKVEKQVDSRNLLVHLKVKNLCVCVFLAFGYRGNHC